MNTAKSDGIIPKSKAAGALLGFCIFFLFSSASAETVTKNDRLARLITNGSYLVQFSEEPLAYREKDLFTPGSTLKIATSLMALDLLGEDFRYPTSFYLDKNSNLHIKGSGDPFLISEEVLNICIKLKQRGITQIHSIFLDDSAFALEHPTPGSANSTNPYDVPNGALAVNFNTISIVKKSNGVLISGEPQTPDLPLLEQFRPLLQEDNQRFNIHMLAGKAPLSPQLQYAGQLFKAQLQKVGIEVGGSIQRKLVPKGLKPLLVHESSKPLVEVLRSCLHYSNNFIANQVLLSCCLHINKKPATWSAATTLFTDYLKDRFGFTEKDIHLDDGAGLSRKNQMSASALVTILDHFSRYRLLLNRKGTALVKSGTLDGVYCYAGYLQKDNIATPFAVLLNQKENTRDRILLELQRINRNKE